MRPRMERIEPLAGPSGWLVVFMLVTHLWVTR